ncbi:hypothetical protein [Henriciella aquimarina]|uniref:hypothetical protein n=1 Tax=Henriciella aquimarina TaxID=545261 RepID=UPI000A01731B|nr:hypothetical protein [Henriciella aquimarina]
MGTGNKAEMLIAICAVLTSVIALFVAWDQGRVMRAQQHGAVFPVVQIDGFVSTTADHASMGVRLSNSGVGPALIERVQMLKDGAPVDSLQPYVDRLPENYDLSWSGLTGRAIAPGAEVAPIELLWTREDISDDRLNSTAAEWAELSLEVCYCSVFDRCWVTRGIGTARSERVKQCEQSDADIFEALATRPALSTTDTPEVD